MKKAETIDQYIADAPHSFQSKLKHLRKLIKEVAPQAEERISYGMPYYGYKGRLAYFAYSKDHIGLYIPPPVIAEHKEELANYGTSTGTVRFPHKENLPVGLIKKLIKARLKKNQQPPK